LNRQQIQVTIGEEVVPIHNWRLEFTTTHVNCLITKLQTVPKHKKIEHHSNIYTVWETMFKIINKVNAVRYFGKSIGPDMQLRMHNVL
jgi:hypothetical protein